MTGFTQRLCGLSGVDIGGKTLNTMEQRMGHCQGDFSAAPFCVRLYICGLPGNNALVSVKTIIVVPQHLYCVVLEQDLSSCLDEQARTA